MLTDSPTEDESQAVEKHFLYLKELTEKGVVLMAGRTTNNDASTFGIVILETETESDARSIMENDPSVRQNIMTAKLFPYQVALMSGK
jgi:uncharacterized protein YciI